MNANEAKELAEKICYNIIDDYEKFISENQLKINNGNLSTMLKYKVITIKDSDLSYEKFEEYEEGTEKKVFREFQGKCLRQKFFDLTQNVPDDNELLKIKNITNSLHYDFLQFLKNRKMLINEKQKYSLNFQNKIIIEGEIDLYDKKGKEHLLMFESIKNNCFISGENGKPILRHLIKAVPAMIYFGKPLTFIYQDRGTMEITKYELELKKMILFINGIEFNLLNIQDIIIQMNKLYNNLIFDKVLPERSYKPYKKSDIFILSKKNILNRTELNNLFAGLKILPFDCQKCKYQNICDSLPEEEQRLGV